VRSATTSCCGWPGHDLGDDRHRDAARGEEDRDAEPERGRQPDEEGLQADGIVRERHARDAVHEPVVRQQRRSVEDRDVVVDPPTFEEEPRGHHEIALVVVGSKARERRPVCERAAEPEQGKLERREREDLRGEAVPSPRGGDGVEPRRRGVRRS
jgi:hypothetical protein